MLSMLKEQGCSLLNPMWNTFKQVLYEALIWMVSESLTRFNTYIALITAKQPERVKDLLACVSIIVSASKQFGGIPWLEYDARFWKEAAVQPGKQWASIDASTWMLCFTSAKPKQELTQKGQDMRFHLYKP